MKLKLLILCCLLSFGAIAQNQNLSSSGIYYFRGSGNPNTKNPVPNNSPALLQGTVVIKRAIYTDSVNTNFYKFTGFTGGKQVWVGARVIPDSIQAKINAGGSNIIDAFVNVNGDLILNYSDGIFDNVGHVVGAMGTPGSAGTNGTAATVNVGTTATLPAGSTALVTNSGNNTNAVFNFFIPQGAAGTGGGGGNISIYGSVLAMLKSTQNTGIAVTTSFHAGTNYGGDIWYVDNATLKSDYVNHFKSNNGTVCWHRLMPDACLSDVDFGAPNGTKTLAQYGYTQSDVNLIFDPSYGIVTGDNADDAAHITTGKGWLKNYMCIFQAPVIINTKKDVDLGKENAAYANAEVFNRGNGMRVNLLATNQTGYKRKAASWSESEFNNNFAGTSFNYEGYVVVGIEGANQTFINTDASFQMTTSKMHVNSVDYPFKQFHCMQTEFSNINIWSPIIGISNKSMSGLYPDANSANSGGNMALYSNTRVYCTPRTQYGWVNFESSSPVWQNTISEGPAGGLIASILVENGNATVTKDAVIRTIHLENQPIASGSQIQLKTQREFTFTMADVWSQGGGTLVSLQGSGGSPRIFMDRTPWIRGKDVKFDNAGTTAQWSFLDTQVFDGELSESAYWVGGNVPAWLKIDGMGSQCYERKMTFDYKVTINNGAFKYNNKIVATTP